MGGASTLELRPDSSSLTSQSERLASFSPQSSGTFSMDMSGGYSSMLGSGPPGPQASYSSQLDGGMCGPPATHGNYDPAALLGPPPARSSTAAPPATLPRTSQPPPARPTASGGAGTGTQTGGGTQGSAGTPGRSEERTSGRRGGGDSGSGSGQVESEAEQHLRSVRNESLRKAPARPAQAPRSAARIPRQRLFIPVAGRSFWAPRSLDLDLPTPRAPSSAAHPDRPSAVPDPGAARAAFANAARDSESLYGRIIAGAVDVARDADAELVELTEASQRALMRSLARLEDDLAGRRGDAAARRDALLGHIGERADLLRYYVTEAVRGALDRMRSVRRDLLAEIGRIRGRTNPPLAELEVIRDAAYEASNGAHFAIQRLQLNPRRKLELAPELMTSKEVGTAMSAAMLEAADHYGPPRYAADDQALADRLDLVSKFVDPLIACTRCEVDSKLQAVDSHAASLGLAGPRALRSARDSSLRSIDLAEERMIINVQQAFQSTIGALEERREQTRAMMIAQAAQGAVAVRRDIEGSSQRQVEALLGVAAAQPAAVSIVHDEVEKAAAAAPARAAAIGTQSAERLQRNIRNTAQRHPSSLLASAERSRAGRRDRAARSAGDQIGFVEGFDDQQAALVTGSFSQATDAIDETLFGMGEMPAQAGQTCDSMLHAAREAIAKVRETTDEDVTYIVQKLQDARDGGIPPPPRRAGGPDSEPVATPAPLASTQPDPMAVFSLAPPMSSMSSQGPLMSSAASPLMTPASSPMMSPLTWPAPIVSTVAPQATSSAPAARPTATTSARASSTPSRPRSSGPASCGTCESVRAAALGPAPAAGSAAQTGNTAGGTAGGQGGQGGQTAARQTSGGGDDVGVSSQRTDMRSPRSYKRFCDPIAENPLRAPRTAAFVTLVHRNLLDKIETKVEAAYRAIQRRGETNYGLLFKESLRGLTALQGQALSERYLAVHKVDLASEIRAHAHDSPFTARSTDDYNSNAAIDALEGRAANAALNELRAAFNYSNETDRIFLVMQSLSHDQMQELVGNHRQELESLMGQLSDEDQARFRLLMENNTVRARSSALKGMIDEASAQFGGAINSDRRAFAIGDAIARGERTGDWGLEGPADRRDVFDLEDQDEKDARNRRHREDILRDFVNVDGVADAIAQANPNAAVSRPDDTPGAALLAYATRPLTYDVQSAWQREGETREQAAERQRQEFAQQGVTLGDEHLDEEGWAVRTATQSMSEYQLLYLRMLVLNGSQSREARAARALAQFNRRDGVLPDYKDLDLSLHSGRADAREGGQFEHGSREDADTDRLATFAMMERFRRQIEGGPPGEVDANAARAAFRQQMENAYRGRTDELAVALGVIDSDEGNIQAVIELSIRREDPALLTQYLGRMDSRQIETVVATWNREHRGGPDLMRQLGVGAGNHWSWHNWNGAVFTGDEANALELAMHGVPQTPQERGALQLRILEQQVEQAGWLGKLLCGREYDAMVENAQRLRDVMGVKEGQIDDFGHFRAIDPETGQPTHFNFDANGNFIPAHTGDESLFESLMATSQLLADNYTQAVDSIAAIITTGIALIAAVVLSVVTMGAGTAFAIALLAGALTIAVNASMKGGRYSRDDLTRDLVAAAVQAVTAGIGTGIANVARGARLAAVAGESAANFARTLGPAERVLLTASRHPIITQTALGAFSSGVTAALDPAVRRREDSGEQVAHAILRGALGGAVTGAVAHGLNSAAGAANEANAARRAAALAAERGASKEAAMRLAGMSATRLMSGRFMTVGFRAFVNATSATAGRATELSYENVAGTAHHSSAEMYGELRQAFIQNAIQGVAEGVASRALRNYGTNAVQHELDMNDVREAARKAAGERFDKEMTRRGVPPDVVRAGATGPPKAASSTTGELAAPRPGEEPAGGGRRSAITDESQGTSLTRPRPGGEEAEATVRPAPVDEGDELRSNIPRSERDTIPEMEAVKASATAEERPLTFAELAASKAGPAPGQRVVDTLDLTPELLGAAHSLPEGSIIKASNPTDAAAAERNYHLMRQRDPHREVLLAFHAESGEYAVVQGGLDSVRKPPGGGWIAERHSHPRTFLVNEQAAILHSLPSGKPGDFGALLSEAQALAARPERGGVAVRASRIDVIQPDGSVTETTFAVVLQDQKMELMVTFRDPAGAQRQLGPFSSIADYGAEVFRLTGTDITAPAPRVTPEGAYNLPGARRSPPVTVDDISTARFVAERMAAAAEGRGPIPELGVPAERQVAPFSAAAEEAHAAVRRMGLVGEPDSLSRLTALLNHDDPALTPAMRAALANATLEATRADMIRSGQLAPGDDVVMLFRGVSRERLGDYEREGMNLAKLGPGKDEDASRGLYGSQDFESSLRYTGEEAGGLVLPLIVRRSELGNVIDVRSGTPLGDRWLQFIRGSRGKGRIWAEHAHLRGVLEPRLDLPIALERDARGTRFEAFLKSIAADPTLPEAVRSAARDPHLTMMDLGGVASTGNDRGILTDQWAMHSQHIADMFNEAHGFPIPGREGSTPIAGDEGDVMHSNIRRERRAAELAGSAEEPTRTRGASSRQSEAERAPPTVTVDESSGRPHWVEPQHEADALARIAALKGVSHLIGIIHDLAAVDRSATMAVLHAPDEASARLALNSFREKLVAAGTLTREQIELRVRRLDFARASLGGRFRTEVAFAAGRFGAGTDLTSKLARWVEQSAVLRMLHAEQPDAFLQLHERFTAGRLGAGGRNRVDNFERYVLRALRVVDENLATDLRARAIVRDRDEAVLNMVDRGHQIEAAQIATPGLHSGPEITDAGSLRVGMRVDHPEHGRGTVRQIGPNGEVSIDFDAPNAPRGHMNIDDVGLRVAFEPDPHFSREPPPIRSREFAQEQFTEIERSRSTADLPGYDFRDTETGTVARIKLGKDEFRGTNSGLDPANYALTVGTRRALFERLARSFGLDAEHLGRAKFLSHAEAEALIRAYTHFGALPEVVEMFVDRPTCDSCTTNLVRLAQMLGVKELRIYYRGQSKPPLILKVKP